MAHEIVLSKGRQVPKDAPRGCDPQLWNLLSAIGQPTIVPLRHLLAEEGEELKGVWLVASGLLALQKGNCVLDIAAPGEAVGGALVGSASGTPPLPISIHSLQRSEVLFLPLAPFREALAKSELLESFIQRNFKNRMLFQQSMRSISHLDVGARLARLLLMKQHIFEENHLTRKLMAQMIGTTTESVIRLFSDWIKTGWLKEIDGKLKILEPQKLEERWLAPTE